MPAFTLRKSVDLPTPLIPQRSASHSLSPRRIRKVAPGTLVVVEFGLGLVEPLPWELLMSARGDAPRSLRIAADEAPRFSSV